MVTQSMKQGENSRLNSSIVRIIGGYGVGNLQVLVIAFNRPPPHPTPSVQPVQVGVAGRVKVFSLQGWVVWAVAVDAEYGVGLSGDATSPAPGRWGHVGIDVFPDDFFVGRNLGRSGRGRLR